ncbi:MAG: hypothetical protein J6X93_06285 [Bacilli bacterium]|nr:hypothetical protein [Bacilli bacterium]
MSKLFIYYSNTGSGDAVASKLATLGYEIRKVTPKKDLPKAFFFKVMSGGFLASLNAKAKLNEFDANIEGYEEVVIGSPIWNGRLSTPINTVLSLLDLNGKNVSFILYAGSGAAKAAPKQIKKFVSEAKITILKEPKKYPEELEKIGE